MNTTEIKVTGEPEENAALVATLQERQPKEIQLRLDGKALVKEMFRQDYLQQEAGSIKKQHPWYMNPPPK